MAQLPPKIPNMQPTWPEFSPQKLPSSMATNCSIISPSNNNNAANNNNNNNVATATATATTSPATTAITTQNPSWVDEFLDFSSARRGTHRRSMSDSIAFLEAPLLEESRGSAAAAGQPYHHHIHGSLQHNTTADFDKFDDEQFLSMFTDDKFVSEAPPSPPCSNPSTPSDHNSFNDDQKETTTTPTPSSDQRQQHNNNKTRNESDEVQSQCHTTSETQTPPPATNNTNSCDRIFDPKRVKRILANRQSAQRSRVRKLQYISELERSVTSLQAEVSVLSPRVAFLDHQRLLLNVDNSALKQRMAALAQDKIFKDAHQAALKREIERLRQVYHQQNLKKMENNVVPSSSTATDPTASNDKEQQLLQV